ncbi:MAG: sterol desaturase family protein [Vicinamibacterales bacterium]
MNSVRAQHPVLQAIEALVYSPINYTLTLLLDVAGAVGFLIAGVLTPMPLASRVGTTVAGFATWGLLEYIIHRWVGHGPPSIARRGHAAHHADEVARVASPAFMILGGAVLIWMPLAALAGVGASAMFVGGAYAGYNHYALMHHVMHHGRHLLPRLGLERVQAYHTSHHQNQSANFGVTLTLWDRVFGTYRAERRSNTSRS